MGSLPQHGVSRVFDWDRYDQLKNRAENLYALNEAVLNCRKNREQLVPLAMGSHKFFCDRKYLTSFLEGESMMLKAELLEDFGIDLPCMTEDDRYDNT